MRFAFTDTASAAFLAAAVALIGCSHNAPADTQTSLDYGSYRKTLTAYVSEDGLVDYAGLKENRECFDQFVAQLPQLSRASYDQWTREEQLAFWMNTYNALTLKAVIDHYPVKSIKDIGSALKSVWDKLTFNVMEDSLTLNQIEHKILRKQFKDPRIHMAINCASIGCPPLANEPLQAERLDEQFKRLTERFLARPSNFTIDRSSEIVYVSSIFKWFGGDFVEIYGNEFKRPGFNRKENAVLNYIGLHLDHSDQAFLRRKKFEVKYLDYDWGLNKQ